MSEVQVEAHRWSGGWELQINGDPVTQVSTLDQAQQQVKDYLDTLDPTIDHGAWEVRVIPALGGLEDQVQQARKATAEATAATVAAAAKTREVVRQLRAQNVSVTDTAAILGVSRGRVSQLAKG